jgi:hypothetical protein
MGRDAQVGKLRGEIGGPGGSGSVTRKGSSSMTVQGMLI